MRHSLIALFAAAFLFTSCSKSAGTDTDDNNGNGGNGGGIPTASTDLANYDSTYITPGFISGNSYGYVTFIGPANASQLYVGLATSASTYNGTTTNSLVRLNANGTLDQSFNSTSAIKGAYNAASPQVNQVKVLSDGKLGVVGTFIHNNTNGSFNIAVLNSNGTLDNSFNLGGTGPEGTGLFALEEDANGKLLVGGRVSKFNNTFESKNIYRFNRNGTLDASFNVGTGFNNFVTDIKIDKNNRIWVAGNFKKYNTSTDCQYLAILNSNGTLYKAFTQFTKPGSALFAEGINKILFQKDGKVIIAGTFVYSLPNGKFIYNIARLNADGSLDNTFNYDNTIGSYSGSFNCIAFNSAEDILVGGDFIYSGNIELLKNDGSPHPGFIQGDGTNGYVNALYIDANDRFYVGGSFGLYMNKPVKSFMRLKGGK